ncbi:MAG: cytochrome c oxidase accessory protein CcoG, partial [Arenicellales bacterium]
MSTPEIRVTQTDLYAKHVKIHPRKDKGFFNNLRNASVIALLVIYYIFPWFNWNGKQAVLWDLPNRKFHIFDLTIWPQDFFFLTALLIIASLALFFFTTVAGRLWCGYACPQTVWARALLWIEEITEGDRNKRIKLDKAPWNGEKFRKKGLKYILWIVFSVWTGFTFVGYFSSIRELTPNFFAFSMGSAETFWVFFYAFMIWLLGAVMREQVCIYMCPYARFQSVMYDPDTLLIAYDEQRGEPRAKGKRKEGSNSGDCVECSVCVQVCPMGIDIRDGLQYQCTGCALCIDACNNIMEKVDKPLNLIRYTTENRLKGKGTNIMRPRVYIYGVLITAMLAAVVWGILNRNPIALDIIRDRNTLYRDSGDGNIENLYRLRIMNKHSTAHRFSIEIDGLDNAILEMDNIMPIIESGTIHDQIIRVKIEPSELNGARSTEFGIKLTAEDNAELSTIEET